MMVHELGGRASQPNIRPIPLFKILKGTGRGSELPNSLRFGHAPDTRIAEMRSELPRIAHELPPELPNWPPNCHPNCQAVHASRQLNWGCCLYARMVT